MENTTETNTDTSTETPTQEAPATGAAEETSAENPAIIGKLTPEELTALTTCQQKNQQILAKIGEHYVLSQRLVRNYETISESAQHILDQVTQRLGLEKGQQWVATNDGTIVLTGEPQLPQPPNPSEEGDAEASS